MHALITNSNQSAATNRSDIQLDITGRNTTAGQHISFSNKSQRLRQILYAPFCQPAPTSATITGTALVFDRHMPLFQKPEQCTLSFTEIPELPAAGGRDQPDTPHPSRPVPPVFAPHRYCRQKRIFSGKIPSESELAQIIGIDLRIDLSHQIGTDFHLLRCHLDIVRYQPGIDPWNRIGTTGKRRIQIDGLHADIGDIFHILARISD